MGTIQPNRIVAVEIRAARLGYAVFESSGELRDFGAATFSSSDIARHRVARLLRLYQPSLLVLRGAGSRYPRNTRIRKTIARVIRGRARRASIPSSCVSERSFKLFFKRYSCHDKYDIAVALAKWYPELAWRVPRGLKFYDPEPSQMLYFDSIALAVAYLALSKKVQMGISGNGTLSPASK